MISVKFADVGVSAALFVGGGKNFKYSVDLSADFDGVLKLKRSTTGGQTWDLVETVAADISSKTRLEERPSGALWRFEVELGAGEETLTGTAAVKLEDVLPGSSVGEAVGPSVSVAEYDSRVEAGAVVRRTVLSLKDFPVPVESVTNGAGVGGAKVYGFPAGRILVLGCMADLALAVAAGKQADFTDATPAGDVGVGSAAPANADALGTDATDDDYATATEFTMADYAAAAKVPSEPALQHDGTGTPKDVFVNALVDAADIDDDAETEILVSGTITLTWINLGDF